MSYLSYLSQIRHFWHVNTSICQWHVIHDAYLLGGGDASASAPPELTTCLRQSFLSLLNYGADVNINLNWRRALDHDEEEVTPPTPLNLTLCEGEVNCDVDHERPPLHESDQVQARMDQDVLVRLLTNVGMGINCPQLPGDADPLVLEEVKIVEGKLEKFFGNIFFERFEDFLKELLNNYFLCLNFQAWIGWSFVKLGKLFLEILWLL